MKNTYLFLLNLLLLVSACQPEPLDPNEQTNQNIGGTITYELNGIAHSDISSSAKNSGGQVNQTVIELYDTSANKFHMVILGINPYIQSNTIFPLAIDNSNTNSISFRLTDDGFFPDTSFRNVTCVINSIDLTNELIELDFEANGAYSITPDTIIELPSLQITNGHISIIN